MFAHICFFMCLLSKLIHHWTFCRQVTISHLAGLGCIGQTAACEWTSPWWQATAPAKHRQHCLHHQHCPHRPHYMHRQHRLRPFAVSTWQRCISRSHQAFNFHRMSHKTCSHATCSLTGQATVFAQQKKTLQGKENNSTLLSISNPLTTLHVECGAVPMLHSSGHVAMPHPTRNDPCLSLLFRTDMLLDCEKVGSTGHASKKGLARAMHRNCVSCESRSRTVLATHPLCCNSGTSSEPRTRKTWRAGARRAHGVPRQILMLAGAQTSCDSNKGGEGFLGLNHCASATACSPT